MMRDFTLIAYSAYLQALKSNGHPFILFNDAIKKKLPEKFCLIRHDVDRKPKNALKMAKLEQEIGVLSTYYFRSKPNSFDPTIMKEVYDMGHEVGYHYENLSDTNGNYAHAISDFIKNLEKFRKIVPIHTISMHGRPLKPFDNRDLWRNITNHELLKESLDIAGEVYLDIDYKDIAYINDTGRNWSSDKSNMRDKVSSLIPANFANGKELLGYLKTNPHPRICLQIHPERWTNDFSEWMLQATKDFIANTIKFVLCVIR